MISLAAAAGPAAHVAAGLAAHGSATGTGERPVTIASFYGQPWWMIILKVVVIFAFLMVTTLFTIWAERRLIGRMQQLWAVQHLFLVGRVRIADPDPHQEAIELRFRQRERPVVLPRVLRGDHHERLRQRPRMPVNRHLILVHGFEQRRLGLRGRTINLVG